VLFVTLPPEDINHTMFGSARNKVPVYPNSLSGIPNTHGQTTAPPFLWPALSPFAFLAIFRA
jgi:hypothetical protein